MILNRHQLRLYYHEVVSITIQNNSTQTGTSVGQGRQVLTVLQVASTTNALFTRITTATLTTEMEPQVNRLTLCMKSFNGSYKNIFGTRRSSAIVRSRKYARSYAAELWLWNFRMVGNHPLVMLKSPAV